MAPLSRLGLLVLVGTFVTVPRGARACGVSGPDGVSACSLEEHEEATRPKWRIGASGVYTSTSLRFGGDLRADETRMAALASVAFVPARRLSIQGGIGAAVGGRLAVPGGNEDFSPGPIADVGVSYRILDGHPFLVVSSLLSFSATTTRTRSDTGATGYQALDLRGGVLFGTTLFDTISPYAAARIFGGPVFWRYRDVAVTGTDVSHYQVAGGLALGIAHRVDLFAEGVPLGELAIAAGFSLAL